jgi:hypothetical protein
VPVQQEHDEESSLPNGYEQGDSVGVLLGLGDGPLRFFKNGAQHGPGFAAGSVTGPVPRGSCSSANVLLRRERATTAKRTAARVNDLQGRRRYLSMASKGAKAVLNAAMRPAARAVGGGIGGIRSSGRCQSLTAELLAWLGARWSVALPQYWPWGYVGSAGSCWFGPGPRVFFLAQLLWATHWRHYHLLCK